MMSCAGGPRAVQQWREVRSCELGLSMLVPPRLLPLLCHSDGEHLAFGARTIDCPQFTTTLDVYRYPIATCASPPIWQATVEGLAGAQEWDGLTLSTPSFRSVGGQMGVYATFCYVEPARGATVAGAAWAANIAGDHLAMLYRCSGDQESWLMTTMTGILGATTFSLR